jgi:hypothetical protein
MSGSFTVSAGRSRASRLLSISGGLIAPLERKNGWTVAEQAGHDDQVYGKYWKMVIPAEK